MNRTTRILAAAVAAVVLTASLAIAAGTAASQPDAGQTSTWQRMMGTASGHMGQIGFRHMSAEGYGHMGGNGYGHMTQADFDAMRQNGYGHMGGRVHMGNTDRSF